MEHLMFTLVTFILFTAAVGVISAKIVKGGDDQKTAKGYFLAGSGLGGGADVCRNAVCHLAGRIRQ